MCVSVFDIYAALTMSSFGEEIFFSFAHISKILFNAIFKNSEVIITTDMAGSMDGGNDFKGF